MNIGVKNISQSEAVIEIEGVIGISEQSQSSQIETSIFVSTYEKFRKTLSSICDNGVKKVRVNIRSIGGSVEDALLIHAALCELSEVEIETHCYGFVASAATIIAQAASDGGRYVADTAMYLIHNASTLIEGNATQATATAAMLSKTDQRIAQIYALRSGMKVEHFVELMARNQGRGEWLSAQEAVEYGLADSVERMSPIKNFIGRVRDLLRLVVDIPHREAKVLETLSVQDGVRNEHPIGQTLDVLPTVTLPKEDPTVEHSVVSLTGNRKSYICDAELFRR